MSLEKQVRIFFSDPAALPFIDGVKVSINWSYLATDIATLVPERRETGISEIERVIHGECFNLRDGTWQRTMHWNPLQFASERHRWRERDALILLQETTQQCVDAWSSCYDGIVALLSGGLDSSIVVNLLKRSPSKPRVLCINYSNSYDRLSDERSYAKLSAELSGYPLLELTQEGSFSLEGLLTLPRLISPCMSFFQLGEAKRQCAIAGAHAAGAYFLGHGGDQVFFQGAADYMVADYLHSRSLDFRGLEIALGSARIRRTTVWKTLIQGLLDSKAKDPLRPLMRLYEFSPLLTREVVDEVKSRRMFIPHWFELPCGAPPGKCWQVVSLSMNESLHDLTADELAPEIVHPLLSQPIQELCLRIPTELLALRGVDRGLARQAFRQFLPPEVVRRQSKGTIPGLMKAIWLENLEFVREFLLGGLLIKERLVDAERLERTLRADFSESFACANNVFSLTGAEAWVRGWWSDARRVAH